MPLPLRRLRRLALSATFLALAPLAAQAVPIIGLTTTNALLKFDSASPTFGTTLASITGLQAADERILAIDLRPTTGVLYGVSDASKVYTLSTGGAATFVAALSQAVTGAGVLDIDFNPVADLSGLTSLRIVSGAGQNLAFNVTSGVTVVATPVQAGFAAVAYSNNDTNPATGTALYYVDSSADLLKVATANFNAPTINTVGALGINANGVAGLDILGASTAFAALTDADTGKSGLYTVNLGTGAASFAGEFGIGGNVAIAPPLLDLTVAAIPEPETYALMLGGLLAVGTIARRRRQAA